MHIRCCTDGEFYLVPCRTTASMATNLWSGWTRRRSDARNPDIFGSPWISWVKRWRMRRKTLEAFGSTNPSRQPWTQGMYQRCGEHLQRAYLTNVGSTASRMVNRKSRSRQVIERKRRRFQIVAFIESLTQFAAWPRDTNAMQRESREETSSTTGNGRIQAICHGN